MLRFPKRLRLVGLAGVLALADQIVLVHRGRVEQAGSPSEVYDHPASPFVMTFIGASTRLHGAWHRPHDIDLRTEPGQPDPSVNLGLARIAIPAQCRGHSDCYEHRCDQRFLQNSVHVRVRAVEFQRLLYSYENLL